MPFAASIAVPSSVRHGAPGGMVSASTQIVRPRERAASTNAMTFAWSRRA